MVYEQLPHLLIVFLGLFNFYKKLGKRFFAAVLVTLRKKSIKVSWPSLMSRSRSKLIRKNLISH